MADATRIDGLSAIAVLLIASFAIERCTTGILFLLDFVPFWRRILPDPILKPEGAQRLKAERNRKLIYFLLAAAFSVAVIFVLKDVRGPDGKPAAGSGILSALGFQQHWIDILVTMLILMGGAERISEVLKGMDASPAGGEKPAPIEITGKLTLDEGTVVKK